MKTSLDIPDKELRDLMRFTRARTKQEAIVTAVADYNRRQRMAALARHFGTFVSLMTNEEIEALGGQVTRGGARDGSVSVCGFASAHG